MLHDELTYPETKEDEDVHSPAGIFSLELTKEKSRASRAKETLQAWALRPVRYVKKLINDWKEAPRWRLRPATNLAYTYWRIQHKTKWGTWKTLDTDIRYEDAVKTLNRKYAEHHAKLNMPPLETIYFK